jgi:hypothetical protein
MNIEANEQTYVDREKEIETIPVMFHQMPPPSLC